MFKLTSIEADQPNVRNEEVNRRLDGFEQDIVELRELCVSRSYDNSRRFNERQKLMYPGSNLTSTEDIKVCKRKEREQDKAGRTTIMHIFVDKTMPKSIVKANQIVKAT